MLIENLYCKTKAKSKSVTCLIDHNWKSFGLQICWKNRIQWCSFWRIVFQIVIVHVDSRLKDTYWEQIGQPNLQGCHRTHSSSRTGMLAIYPCPERTVIFTFCTILQMATLTAMLLHHCVWIVRVYEMYHFSTDYCTVMSSIWTKMKGILILLDVELGWLCAVFLWRWDEWVFNCIQQWSQPFLEPGTSFVKDNFSTDGVGDGFRMIQVHYIQAHLQLCNSLPNRC